MPDFKLPLAEPGRNDTETLQNLLDTMLKYRKELNFLLQNLDADNVLEAKSVIADWIYAGQVTTDQLIAGKAKIGTALIEDLIVGGNVSMGPDATISWGKVLDIPQSIVYDTEMTNYVANQLLDYIDIYTFNSELDKYALATDLANFITGQEVSTRFNNLLYYSNLDTILGQDYIITGKLAANQIASGRISSQYLATDISQVYNHLYLGEGYLDESSITFPGIGSIDGYNQEMHLSAMWNIQFDSDVSFNAGTYFYGYVDFTDASVDGLNVEPDTSYLIESWYSSNKCYIDLASTETHLIVRNIDGVSVGRISLEAI